MNFRAIDQFITGPGGNAFQLLLDENNSLSAFKPKDSQAVFWTQGEGREPPNDIVNWKNAKVNFPTDYFQPDKSQLAKLNEEILRDGFSFEPGEGRSVVGFRTIDATRPEIAGRGVANSPTAGWGWQNGTPETPGSYQIPIYGSAATVNQQQVASAPPPPPRAFPDWTAERRQDLINTVANKPVLPDNPAKEFDVAKQAANWRGDKQEAKDRAKQFEGVLARMNKENLRPYSLA